LLNLNKASLSLDPINSALNAEIERVAMATAEQPRPYLGVSIAGYECARRVQFTWWIKSEHPARVRAIFDRGHYFEGRVKECLKAIGFKFAAEEALAFSAVGGALRGHADGIIIAGPKPYFAYPAILEVKALNAKNWRALERDGLRKTFPQYAAQVALYQAYLDITNPALFIAVNADDCQLLFFLVPFDAELAQFYSDRAANIIAATRTSELLPRAFDDPEDFRCRMCPYRKRCWELPCPKSLPASTPISSASTASMKSTGKTGTSHGRARSSLAAAPRAPANARRRSNSPRFLPRQSECNEGKETWLISCANWRPSYMADPR